MQAVLDVLGSVSAYAAAFWSALVAAVTWVGAAWHAAQQVRTIHNLTALSWQDLGRHITAVPWEALYSGTLFSARFVVGLASVVSAVTTIIGVRYYFRQTNEYSLKKKFEALQEIISLTVELRGEISDLNNADSIGEARKELNRFLISRESLFDKSLREQLVAKRSAINTMAKALIRLDKRQDATITNRSKASTEYQMAYKELDKELSDFKKFVEKTAETLLHDIQKSATTIV